MDRFTGIIGAVVLLAIAYGMSNNRSAISKRTVLWGLGLQLFFALFILKTPIGQPFFSAVDKIFLIEMVFKFIISIKSKQNQILI